MVSVHPTLEPDGCQPAPDFAVRRKRRATPKASLLLWYTAVSLLLAGAFGLRIWGIKHGLPYIYNVDEGAHFVPGAIAVLGGDFNPHYFNNPPGFTYLLAGVFALWFKGGAAAVAEYHRNPAALFLVARVTTAVLGTSSVGLTYLAGARLFDRRVGLLAAGLLAVAFLPVYYAHLALNDVPTLLPVSIALVGVAGILRSGRPVDFIVAGFGLGAATAFKYTAAIMLLPIIAAALCTPNHLMHRQVRRWGLLTLAVSVAAVAFFALNPYALLSPQEFLLGIRTQSDASSDVRKLGMTGNGVFYYLWTLTWGLGWLPALTALGGSIALCQQSWRQAGVLGSFRSALRPLTRGLRNPGIGQRRIPKRPKSLAEKKNQELWRWGVILTPAPVIFILLMGIQSRFWGRWLLPIFPIVVVLSAYGAFGLIDRISNRWKFRWRVVLAISVTACLTVQPLLYVIHDDIILSRPDTRADARTWMLKNVPAGSKVVIEPIASINWAKQHPLPIGVANNPYIWVRFKTGKSMVNNDGTLRKDARPVKREDYQRILRPDLVGSYVRGGYCYVVAGSDQWGRAFAQSAAAAQAIDYYDELTRKGTVIKQFSPYKQTTSKLGPGHDTVKFNFDWSFDYYPLVYRKPGPVVNIFHLRGEKCGH